MIPDVLPQRLGLYTSVMIVMGSMIGSGIFKKPAVMAALLPSPSLLLVCWVLAGVVTLFGALSTAEIAAMIPASGGQYIFFRRIYNRFVAFLYGWSVFSVIQTGSIASIAYVFAEYCGYFFPLPRLAPEFEQISFYIFGMIQITPLDNLGVKLLAVSCILLLTTVNITGVVLGGAIQNIFTTLKIAAIIVLVMISFSFGQGSVTHFYTPTPAECEGNWLSILGAMGLALSGAFWSYDGWNNLSFVSGEIRTPGSSIPRALFLGTSGVLAVYLITNLAFLFVLPASQMAGSQLVAADVMKHVLGPLGGALISSLVIFSTFGATNGSILTSARVHFAMAQDGLFFRSLGRVHPRFQTPARSLLAQGIWAALLVFSGTFDQLTDMLIFVSWIFYLMAALGVFILRRKEAHTARPYRVWGFPMVPGLFILFAGAYVITTLMQNPRDALLGVLLVALGIPLYFFWRHQSPP